MNWMLKNSDGERDAVLTLTVAGFLVILFKFVIAGMSITFSSNTYTAGDIDAATIGALLTPTLGAYVARRYTDRKFDSAKVVEETTADQTMGAGR